MFLQTSLPRLTMAMFISTSTLAPFGIAQAATVLPTATVAATQHVIARPTEPVFEVIRGYSHASHQTGVAYVTIINKSDKPITLTGASSKLATSTELHRSMKATPPTGMGAMPAMSMDQVPNIVIAAHGYISMHPGGLHIMLLGLKRDLKPNEDFPIRLYFHGLAPRVVRVHVSD